MNAVAKACYAPAHDNDIPDLPRRRLPHPLLDHATLPPMTTTLLTSASMVPSAEAVLPFIIGALFLAAAYLILFWIVVRAVRYEMKRARQAEKPKLTIVPAPNQQNGIE